MPRLRISLTMFLLFALVELSPAADPPIEIGSRRELFVDAHLIESLKDARRQLHHPIPQAIAIVNDAPWE